MAEAMMVIHLGRKLPSGSSDLTRKPSAGRTLCRTVPKHDPSPASLFGLASAGVYQAGRSPSRRWALTPPFHPCPAACRSLVVRSAGDLNHYAAAMHRTAPLQSSAKRTTRPRQAAGRSSFLWHFPPVTRGRLSRPACPMKPRLSSSSCRRRSGGSSQRPSALLFLTLL